MKPRLSRPKARAALMEQLEHAVRKSSALGVIFGQTVANRVGVSSSDLECLDFLNIEGRVTAGRLAELTGLTTGAITGVVDRMEKAGLVRRERDESDRRKVFIATVPENIAKVGKFYEHMQRGPEGLGELFGYGAAAAASIHDAGLQDDAGGDRGAQGDDGTAEGQARRVYEACSDAVSAL